MFWRYIATEEKIRIIKQFQSNGLTQGQIAEKVEVCRESIRDFCKRHGIKPIHYQGAQPGNKSAMIDGMGENTIRRLTKKVLLSAGRDIIKCERCGYVDYFKEELPRHHKDRNRSNNDPTNLEVLCRTCHGAEHFNDRERNEKGQFV